MAVLVLTSAVAHAWVDPQLTSALELRAARPLPYDPTRITVRFRPGIDRARVAGVLAESDCAVSFAARFTPGLMDIRIPAGTDFRRWVKTFAARADVLYAEPCYIDYPAFVPNDPDYSKQWHFQQIGLPTAWDIYPARGSSSVTVCVLDSGVAYENHSTYTQAPDLAGVTFVSPYDAVDLDGHPNDTNWHGTHVTGTIAQKTNNGVGVAGTADGVQIMPVRTLGAGGGSHPQFSDGVHHATDNGAEIISYSGGGSDSSTKHDAVIYAYNAGVLFIAAMGNDNTQDPASGYPGRYAEAMGVVATQYTKARAWYSNWGADADISAPGGDTGADLNGDGNPDGVLQQTYVAENDPSSGFALQWFQGTSMATPHVSGLAALLWSQGIYDAGASTRATVRSRIESTAEDLGAAGDDVVFGNGLIRASRALSPGVGWANTTGYENDGVSPDSGNPSDHASPTTFVFKAKYIDHSGAAPLSARCIISRMVCGKLGKTTWVEYKNLAMSLESGTVADGAIYSASTTLANDVLKYRFYFQSGAGGAVPGTPTTYAQGPQLTGKPHLCWRGKPGFTSDGVEPNSGSPKAKFQFAVLYTDSWGTAPTVTDLEILRNGKPYLTKAMTPEKGGDYRLGKGYYTNVIIGATGTYSYRFHFKDTVDWANGTPATWTGGPSITGLAGALTALAAVPTEAGAQITFSLADAADVTATVMNVAGRPVRTIADSKPLDAGLQTLLWDGRAENGLAAPAGLYMVKVTARNAGGEQSSAMASLSLR
jgi:serine protease